MLGPAGGAGGGTIVARARAKLELDKTGFDRDLKLAEKQLQESTQRMERATDRLNVALGNTTLQAKGFGNVVGLIKMPGLIAGLGAAAQAAGALSAGVIGLTSALAPLAGAVAAMPAGMAAMGQAAGALALGLGGVGDALEVAQKKGKEYQEALKELTPAQREFAKEAKGSLIPLYENLRKIAEGNLLPSVTRGLKAAFSPDLKATIRSLVDDTTSVFGGLAERLGRMLGSREWARDIQTIGETNVRIFQRMGEAALKVAPAIRDIVVAAGPMFEQFANVAAFGAEQLAKLVSRAREAGSLTAFFAKTSDTARLLGGILAGLGKTFLEIGKAAYPLGREILVALNRETSKLARWAQSAQGRASLAGYFRAAKPVVFELGRLIGALGKSLIQLSKPTQDSGLVGFLRRIREEVLPLFQDVISGTLSEFGPTLQNTIIEVIRLFGNLAGSNGPLVFFVRTIGDMAGNLADLLEKNPLLKDFVFTLGGLVGIFKALNFATAITGVQKFAGAMLFARTATTAQAVATQGATAAQVGLNAAMRANPIGLVITIIQALAAALILAWQKSETFRKIVTGAWDAIKAGLSKMWDVFKSAFGWIKDNWKLIGSIVGGPIVAIIAFKDKIVGVFNAVRDAIGSAWSWVKTKSGEAADWIKGIPGRLGNLGSRIGEKIKAGLGAARDWVKQHIVDKVVGFFTSLPDRIGDIGSAIGSAITGGIKAAWNALANWFNSHNDITIDVPDILPGPDKYTIGLPDLPTFRTGGTVPQPPGTMRGQDGVLAMLAPGEVVVPVPTVEAMGAEFWRSLGIPGFAKGGKVGPDELKTPPRYGTYWLKSLFQSPVDDGTHTYSPSSKKRRKVKKIVDVPPGTPHVGPTGPRMKGHPLQFPFWQAWWGPGQGEAFSREWAKRNRKGPAKFAAEFAKKHPLAARLLGIDQARLAKLEHWPWYKPRPHPPGAPVGDLTQAPPAGGTDAQRYSRVQRAVRYASYIASLGEPYQRYGGHGGWDYNGPFDCSGFVSHVLHYGLGMLSSPLSTYGLVPGSGGLVGGPGKWVTVWTRNTSDPWTSHTVIQLLGSLWEAGGQTGSSGSRTARSVGGFTPSHPPGYRLGGLVRRIPRFKKGGRVVNRRFPRSLVAPRRPNPPRGPRKVRWGQVSKLQGKIDAKQKAIERADRKYENMARDFDLSVEEFIVVDDEGNESLDQGAINQRAEELRKLIDQKDSIVRMMEQLKQLLADMVQLLLDLRRHYRKKVDDWRENLKKATDEDVKKALQKKIDDAQEKLGTIREELPTARSNLADYPNEIESVRLDGKELRAQLDEVLGTKVTPPEPASSDAGFDDSGGGGDFGGGDTGGVGDGGTGESGPTQEEIEKQIQEALLANFNAVMGARSRFFSEFAPNIFSPSPSGLTLGSTPLAQFRAPATFTPPTRLGFGSPEMPATGTPIPIPAAAAHAPAAAAQGATGPGKWRPPHGYYRRGGFWYPWPGSGNHVIYDLNGNPVKPPSISGILQAQLAQLQQHLQRPIQISGQSVHLPGSILPHQLPPQLAAQLRDRNITVIQHFQRPPTDQFANLNRVRFAVRAALGS